jgi:hypothetical protein
MISSTISIYLAVLLNNAVRDASLHAILDSRCKEGSACASNILDQKIELVIRFIMFIAAFAFTNASCYFFRGTKWMFAAQALSGHITAFAGIELFSNLCQQHEDLTFRWAATFFTFGSLYIFRFAARTFRDTIFGVGEGMAHKRLNAMLANGRLRSEAETEEWREAACEAEDDGCSIFLSYMVNVLVMTHLFGPHYLHSLFHEHTARDLQVLVGAQLTFIGALVLLTYWRRGLDQTTEADDVSTSAYARNMSCLNITVSMSMSWMSQTFFMVFTLTIFPGISHEFDEIVSAAILTASAIVGIIVLDLFADKVVDDGSPVPGNSQLLPVNQVPGALNPIGDVTNLEKALRTVIDGFSLAVGLSWEKAFHAAISTVIKTTPGMGKHYVISQGLLAVGNCILIMPVWLAFIVPMAKKSLHYHEENMRLSRQE